jgi:hypothetical protein
MTAPSHRPGPGPRPDPTPAHAWSPDPASPPAAAAPPAPAYAPPPAWPADSASAIPVYVPEPYDVHQAADGSSVDPPGISAYYEALERTRRRRHRVRVRVGAVLVVALAVGGWWFGFHTSDAPTAPAGSGVAAGQPTDPPDGPGTVYRSAGGHFVVRFADRVTEAAAPVTVGTETISMHVAADVSGTTAVEGADISPAIPQDAVDDLLRGMMHGATRIPGLTVDHDRAATFHGRPAREGVLTTKDGKSLTLLGVVYGTERVYVLIAPTGDAYDALKASFVALA